MRIVQAVVATITPIILALLLPFGINEATPTGEAIGLLLTGLGTGALVWYTRKV